MKSNIFKSKITSCFLVISISLFLISSLTTDIPVIAYTPAIAFSDPVLVSIKDDFDDITTSITTDSKNNSHIVWHERIDNYWNDVRYRKYFSASDSWSSIQTLAAGDINTRSSFPKIKVDSEDNLHVVWYESNYSSGVFGHKYKRITEGLMTETKVITLESVSDSRAYDFVPLNMDEIFFIYDKKNVTYHYSLFYSFYYPNTSTWSPEVQINVSSKIYHWPKTTVDSNQKIHFAWPDVIETEQIELHYQCLNGSTLEYNDPIIISEVDDKRPWIIQIVADGNNNIHFSYLEDKYPYSSSHYRFISNNQLSDDFIIRSSNNTNSFEVDIFADCNNTIHFVWFEHYPYPANPRIHYQRYENLTTWSEIIAKDTGHRTVSDPKISVTLKGDIHIAMYNYFDRKWCIYFYLGTKNLTSNITPTSTIAYKSIITTSILTIIFTSLLRRKRK
ncbi:MAG: hypothetical protein ACTSUP_00125 [Candidatus Heimdallarchaeaceae archaeon]